MDEAKIRCSIFFQTRGRPEPLKRCIDSIYTNAKDKDGVETVLRIDDDDTETLKLFESGCFKDIRNLIVYSGPRVGYDNCPLIWQQIYPTLRGDIFILLSDDVIVVVKDFDEIYSAFKDRAVVFGLQARHGFTRKLIEKDEYIKTLTGDEGGPRADTRIWRYAVRKGLFVKAPKTYRKLEVEDRTRLEGSLGGWKLQDTSILHNLPLKRIYG